MTCMTSALAAAIVEGSILLLNGPLGSGKSTLQRSLVGLQRLPVFSIRIFGCLNERIPNYLLILKIH